MSILRIALSPPPEDEERDTGLRFTDILFGFVIRELFIRLQLEPARPVRPLAADRGDGARAGQLDRVPAEPQPSDLSAQVLQPPARALLRRPAHADPLLPDRNADAGRPAKSPPGAGALAKHTAYILTLIFVLYLLWDFGGILMGAFGKYPHSKPDPVGFAITALVLIAIGAMWLVLRRVDVGRSGAEISFAVASVLLLAYRFLKELRTSVRLVKPKPAGP